MKRMSLLEYDIKMSRYSKYMQISRMPKEEKKNGIILEHTYILCQGDAKLVCCFS